MTDDDDGALRAEADRRLAAAVAGGKSIGDRDRYREAIVADLRAVGWRPGAGPLAGPCAPSPYPSVDATLERITELAAVTPSPMPPDLRNRKAGSQ